MTIRGPRLPSLGYVPPPVPPPLEAPRGATPNDPGIPLDYEAFSQSYPWPGRELVVFRTEKRWRALDVYLDTPNALLFGTVFTVRVYAVLPSGLRTLIASGRLGHFMFAPIGGAAPRVPIWIAAARSQAVKMEVSLVFTSAAGGGVSGEQVTVSCVASDEANEPPPWVGVLPDGIGATDYPDPEMLWISGAADETVGTPRYLHVHDIGGGPIAGLVPQWCFPLGIIGNIGQSQFTVNHRAQSGVFQVAASSTAVTTTAVGDVVVRTMMR